MKQSELEGMGKTTREKDHVEMFVTSSCFFFVLEKIPKEETEEMLLKKTERNRKRRMQAIKRREKHKVGTILKIVLQQLML